MDPITLAAGLLPFIQHAGRVLLAKFAGDAGAEPQNVDEVVKLGELDIRRTEALAELDRIHGDVSPWVANVRALQRPVVGAAVLVVFAVLSVQDEPNPTTYATVANLASSVFAYLFGDRTCSHIFERRK